MSANSQSPFSWDDLKILLALHREKTLTAAGARLRINASTVGRRLDALEETLGARLFDRTPDGVLPTEAAERLVPHAELMEQAASGLARSVEGLESTPEGTVRLTAPPGIVDFFIAPALPRFVQRYPGLVLEIDASVSYADLTRREADLALRVMRPTGGDLVSQKIADEPDAILGSPRYVKKLGVLRSLDDARWIVWGDDLAHIPGARWTAAHVSKQSVVLKTSSLSAQVASASAGVGLAFLSKPIAVVCGLAEAELDRGLASRLAPVPKTPLWLVGHRALRDVPRIAVVWKFVLEEMGLHGSVVDRKRVRA